MDNTVRRYYAHVETYSNGDACIGYVSITWNPKHPCAGEYDDPIEARHAANELCRLLKKGDTVRKNAEKAIRW